MGTATVRCAKRVVEASEVKWGEIRPRSEIEDPC